MYIFLGPTKTYSSKDVPWILFMIKKNWKHTWRKNSLSYDNHRILCTHVNQPESWEVPGCLIKCHKSSRKIQSGRGGHGWARPLKNNGMRERDPESSKQDKPKAKYPKTHINQINKHQTQRTTIKSSKGETANNTQRDSHKDNRWSINRNPSGQKGMAGHT